MFGDGALTFQEFVTREPVPLASIHDAVLEFLRDRDDAVLYGAQAVNAYLKEARMTQDVDIASTRGKELAEDIRRFLNKRFHIAVRGKPKAGTDWRDLASLLLTFPELKTKEGAVLERLKADPVDENVIAAWNEVVDQTILPEDAEDKFVR